MILLISILLVYPAVLSLIVFSMLRLLEYIKGNVEMSLLNHNTYILLINTVYLEDGQQ
jgi:hypothetical protein